MISSKNNDHYDYLFKIVLVGKINILEFKQVIAPLESLICYLDSQKMSFHMKLKLQLELNLQQNQ